MEYMERKQEAVKKLAAIDNALSELFTEIYALGVVEGIKEKEYAVEEAYIRGRDEGYEEAKREFRVPDL